MKSWILIDNADSTKYAVVSSNVKPSGAICEAPEGAGAADGPYISVEEIDGTSVAALDTALKSEVQAAKQAVKAAAEYKDNRKYEYPSIGDQLDALYKLLYLKDPDDYNAIAKKIQDVKAKYPKPE